MQPTFYGLSICVYENLKQCYTMKTKVLILTTTEPGNAFPENFSCWCAGALEAKGCNTALETVHLEEKSIHTASGQSLNIYQEKLIALEETLSVIEKLVLIFPEYDNMIPLGLEEFLKLFSVNTKKNNYKICPLIAISMEPPATDEAHHKRKDLFGYPLDKLDVFLGSNFSANRIQIKDSATGNMCPLFAERYADLCGLIDKILA